jgi:hypothetical protein
MPYVIEHAARVREPSEFRPDTFRRKPLKTSGVTIVMGKLKGGGTSMVAQAYRFDKTKFTPSKAKAWLKKFSIQYIRFDPAKKEYAK